MRLMLIDETFWWSMKIVMTINDMNFIQFQVNKINTL